MFKLRTTFIGALSLLGMAGGFATSSQAASFYASENNKNVAVTSEVKDDAFVAGNSASVNAAVSGELFVAGNTVVVTEPAGRSVYAVGNSVSVNKGSAYNAFVGGNTVVLSGTYGHDVYVAGNSVTLTEGTVINGDLRVAANQLILNGKVNGAVFMAVSSVSSSATIGGSVKAWGQDLAFSGGSIGGNLTYESSKEATGLDKVKVGGATQRTEPPARQNEKPNWAFVWTAIAIWKLLGSIVLAAVLLAVAPKRIQAVYEEVTTQWFSSFSRGVVVLVVGPIVALVMLMLLFGWQVSLLIGALYVAFLMIAHAISFVVLGRYLLERIGRTASAWLGLLLGALLLLVLTPLPVIGWIVGVLYFFGVVLPVLGSLVWREARDDRQ